MCLHVKTQSNITTSSCFWTNIPSLYPWFGTPAPQEKILGQLSAVDVSPATHLDHFTVGRYVYMSASGLPVNQSNDQNVYEKCKDDSPQNCHFIGHFIQSHNT